MPVRLPIAILLCLTCSVASSVDPLDTWVLHKPRPIGDTIRGVAYNDGRFVAVGSSLGSNGIRYGFILNSTNGTTWTFEHHVTEGPYHISIDSVTYGGGTFVAVGSANSEFFRSHPIVLTSISGRGPWRYLLPPGGANNFKGVSYGNGIFVAVGTYYVLDSADAVTWNLNPVTNSFQAVNDIAFGNGIFCTSGSDGIPWTSTDGKNWTLQRSGLQPHPISSSDIAFGNGRFIYLGKDIRTTTDGTNWFVHPLPKDYTLTSIACGNGFFVAGGYLGNNEIMMSSPDGTNWTERLLNDSLVTGLYGIEDIVFGDGRFIAAGGYGGSILESGAFASVRILAESLTWSDGEFTFPISSQSNSILTVQASVNLTNWNDVLQLTNVGGIVLFTNPPTDLNRNYFRVRQE